MLKKIISFVLSFTLITSQPIFAQGAAQINLGNYLRTVGSSMAMDKFRPLHMRYFSYDALSDNFQLLLDKGDNKDIKEAELEEKTKVLMEYFKIGLALPNEKFWVNLRPDAQDQIIDPELEKTDMGRIMLEADLQLKKDTAGLTSPQNPEGKAYWDKLYKKAGELFGSENITIPTITRPWIVPGEIILRQGEDSAYIFKANMKVLLEEDYLKSHQDTKSQSHQYNFNDPRMKELNEYSTQLIRELIIPRLTKEVNSSKRYAALRQVFFSLVMARWFKDTFGNSGSTSAPGTRAPENSYVKLVDSGDLTNLTSKEAWSKTYYFNEYKKSFEKGEYNLKEDIYTPTGQVIRSYISGGVSSAIMTMPPAGLYKGRKHLNAVNAGYENGRFTIKEYPGGKESNSKKRSSSAISQERKKIIASQLNGYLSRKGLNRSLVKNFINRSMDVIGVSFGVFDFRGEAISFDCMESLKIAGVYLVRLSNETGSEFATIYVRIDESISTVWRGEDINLNYIDEFTEKIISALSSQTSSSLTSDEIEYEIKDIRSHSIGPLYALVKKFRSWRDDGEKQKWLPNSSNGINGLSEGYRKLMNDLQKEEFYKDDLAKYRFGLIVESITSVMSGLGYNYSWRIENDGSINQFQYSKKPQTSKEWKENIEAWTKIIENYRETIINFKKKVMVSRLLPDYEKKEVIFDSEEVLRILNDVVARRLNILKDAAVAGASSAVSLNPEKQSNSLPVGGIDFRQMNYLVQPMGSFKDLRFMLPTLSSSALERIDLDKELESLRDMVKAGMVPSGMRVKEYLAACFQKGKIEEKQDDLLVCLAEIYRLAEEENLETSPELRESLVIVDTGKFVLLPNNQKAGLN